MRSDRKGEHTKSLACLPFPFILSKHGSEVLGSSTKSGQECYGLCRRPWKDPLAFVFQPAGWSHVTHLFAYFVVRQRPASLPHSQPPPLSQGRMTPMPGWAVHLSFWKTYFCLFLIISLANQKITQVAMGFGGLGGNPRPEKYSH